MRSVIISGILLAVLAIAITFNAYYINSTATELLDMIFELPSDYEYVKNLDKSGIEKYKSQINDIVHKWEKHAFKISLVTKYQDFERVNLAIYSLKNYFSMEYYENYIVTRENLIIALEKQKHNELANLENIL